MVKYCADRELLRRSRGASATNAEVTMLIIFGGLPGSGKTTIARALAERLNAVHVRVDTIEQAIRASGIADDAGPAGYIVAYGVAGDNLTLGRTVIADS